MLATFSLLFSVHAKAEKLDEILLASEEWQRATLSDGTGLYWDIFRYVYEPAGIKVKTLTFPYETAVSYVQRGRADAWLASYLNEREFALYPQWHFDAEVVSVMYNKDNHTTFEGIESLTNKQVAWITGYAYHLYIDVPMQIHELNNRKSILRMLKRGRIDYFLDAEIDIGLAKKEFYPGDKSLIIKDLIKLKLYPAFADTAKGQKFKSIWDQRMPKIYKTKKMKQLFKQWEFDYPFDDKI
ncbi:substrate-binding periplasmic protein [Maricurvus nonylphenolicus]|uniref:substrate-binding periplasmic protein n=1 Tax=Maricurvus nonylphenolicus TaxID=1008307 RepID=UPI0036F3B128